MNSPSADAPVRGKEFEAHEYPEKQSGNACSCRATIQRCCGMASALLNGWPARLGSIGLGGSNQTPGLRARHPHGENTNRIQLVRRRRTRSHIRGRRKLRRFVLEPPAARPWVALPGCEQLAKDWTWRARKTSLSEAGQLAVNPRVWS